MSHVVAHVALPNVVILGPRLMEQPLSGTVPMTLLGEDVARHTLNLKAVPWSDTHHFLHMQRLKQVT